MFKRFITRRPQYARQRIAACNLLAERAYILACVGPLALLLMEFVDIPTAHHGPLQAIWCGLCWATALCSPLGVLLGAYVLVQYRRRYRDYQVAGGGHAVASVVVGTVTSLVIVIGMPVFLGGAVRRPYSHGSRCISNIRQLNLAIAMYVQDYDDRFPPPNKWNAPTNCYAKNLSAFRCPEAPSAEKRPTYAMNSRLKNSEYTRIVDPVQSVMLFDSVPGQDLSGGIELLTKLPRHYNGQFVGFVDGHVKLETRQQALDLIWTPSMVEKPRSRNTSRADAVQRPTAHDGT